MIEATAGRMPALRIGKVIVDREWGHTLFSPFCPMAVMGGG